MRSIFFFKKLYVFFLVLFITSACADNKVDQLDKLLPELNNRFSFLILDREYSSKIDTPNPPLYIISILTKDKVSIPFDRQKYYFPKNSIGGGQDKIWLLLEQVYNLVDSTYLRNDNVLDLLRGEDTKFAFEKAGLSIEQTINTGEFLAEFATLLKNLYDFKFKKLRVYIKGYADYSPRPWWDIQKEENGSIYRNIQVHPALKTGNQMLFYSDILEERIATSDTFRNSDLPNLRAAYLKEILDTMIRKHLKDNRLYENWAVEILDGSEVGSKADYTQRRGEIMVEIYE